MHQLYFLALLPTQPQAHSFLIASTPDTLDFYSTPLQKLFSIRSTSISRCPNIWLLSILQSSTERLPTIQATFWPCCSHQATVQFSIPHCLYHDSVHENINHIVYYWYHNKKTTWCFIDTSQFLNHILPYSRCFLQFFWILKDSYLFLVEPFRSLER